METGSPSIQDLKLNWMKTSNTEFLGGKVVYSSLFFQPPSDVNEVGDKTRNFALEDGGVASQNAHFKHVCPVILRYNCPRESNCKLYSCESLALCNLIQLIRLSNKTQVRRVKPSVLWKSKGLIHLNLMMMHKTNKDENNQSTAPTSLSKTFNK